MAAKATPGTQAEWMVHDLERQNLHPCLRSEVCLRLPRRSVPAPCLEGRALGFSLLIEAHSYNAHRFTSLFGWQPARRSDRAKPRSRPVKPSTASSKSTESAFPLCGVRLTLKHHSTSPIEYEHAEMALSGTSQAMQRSLLAARGFDWVAAAAGDGPDPNGWPCGSRVNGACFARLCRSTATLACDQWFTKEMIGCADRALES